jgi:hypothetical protein
VADVKALIQQGDQLFSKRTHLVTFWQDVAENFYPERADFTVVREVGDTFAENLMSGRPLLVRRELGNAFSSMLRPRDRAWFSITIEREERLDRAGREFLEWASGVQRRAMYDRRAQFVRATKEGDNDFASFGQCVISKEVNWEETSLLYRDWHLRDVVWCEDHQGQICEVHRRWKPTAAQLVKRFPKSAHENIRRLAEKNPHQEVEVRHVVMRADYDETKRFRTAWVSIYIDVENQHLLEEVGSHSRIYTIPRWQTVSGSQYAYSPATVIALPDARLLQAMTATLLEAGESAVRPPLVATHEAIRGDVAFYPGGITWVDADYDERLGEVLRPITQDKRAFPFGLEIAQNVELHLTEAFYLNKLSLPPMEGEVTAFEVAQRVQEYIRSALPLFEPMEIEYNGSLCEDTFEELMRVGAFGPIAQIPESLRGAEVRFKFESPLHKALEREKGARFEEGRALTIAAAELDTSSASILDVRAALRDALEGVGVPAKWMRDPEVVEQMATQAAEMQQAAQAAALLEQGGKAAKEIGAAEQTMSQAASLTG